MEFFMDPEFLQYLCSIYVRQDLLYNEGGTKQINLTYYIMGFLMLCFTKL